MSGPLPPNPSSERPVKGCNDLVLHPTTLEAVAIGIMKDTPTILLVVAPSTFVRPHVARGPPHGSLAMPQIFEPLAFVLAAIGKLEDPDSVSLVLVPQTRILALIDIDHHPLTMSLPFFPGANIFVAIGVGHETVAFG